MAEQATASGAVRVGSGGPVPVQACWRSWAHRRHDSWGSDTGGPVYPIVCPGVGPTMEELAPA